MSERRTGTNTEGTEKEVQLRLLNGEGRRDWRLDEHTRTAGRRGVAVAREILRRARPPAPDGRRRAS